MAIALVLAGTNAASILFVIPPSRLYSAFLDSFFRCVIAMDRRQAMKWIWLLVPLTVL